MRHADNIIELIGFCWDMSEHNKQLIDDYCLACECRGIKMEMDALREIIKEDKYVEGFFKRHQESVLEMMGIKLDVETKEL